MHSPIRGSPPKCSIDSSGCSEGNRPPFLWKKKIGGQPASVDLSSKCGGRDLRRTSARPPLCSAKSLHRRGGQGVNQRNQHLENGAFWKSVSFGRVHRFAISNTEIGFLRLD
ncbi:hypothetical protein GDO78_021535 [Eleutherodactylus coqui]|uniref:Uncharacterized protein n=1 Tax=Eleutherodactylus coqui TaxID=57060 RepID=A0A8J6BCL9_ELECQ|nr:hypothetical protein GDO78_021535 [Eleutherodactylus coqui]